MKKSTILLLILILLGLILIAGCAAGPNPSVNTAPPEGEIAGFGLGIWHGLICPITFIISLFKDNVHFYEVHNNGHMYNLGFLIGLLLCGA